MTLLINCLLIQKNTNLFGNRISKRSYSWLWTVESSCCCPWRLFDNLNIYECKLTYCWGKVFSGLCMRGFIDSWGIGGPLMTHTRQHKCVTLNRSIYNITNLSSLTEAALPCFFKDRVNCPFAALSEASSFENK